MYKRKARVIFFSTSKSSRSNMAVGYAHLLGKDWIEARSAGVETNAVNSRAIALMAEDGIDISEQVPTKLSPEMLQWADLLVVMSERADENYPILPAHVRKKYWPINDPLATSGSEEAEAPEENLIKVFRATRDEIKRRVTSMVNGMRMLNKSS